MKLGVPKEIIEDEKRVALIPESVKRLIAGGFEVLVENGAGITSACTDEEYSAAGAKMVGSYSELAGQVDILLKVRPVSDNGGKNEASALKDGALIFGMQDAINQEANLKVFADKKQTSFAMEFIPRITLAQSMDVLSSMATIAGYKAVLMAAHEIGRLFPMLMTAAGTIPPARTLILGAGVAGLQAIATARRLGATVEAFDTRPEVKEQVMSLGAKFVEMPHEEDLSDDQGYAKEASEEFIKKEMELIGQHLSKSDVCITTAQVFGRKAPLLITEDMVKKMKPGSVIVDLAVEQGGNCELSETGKIVEKHNVKIIGPQNIAGTMADHASRMYSKNMENLLLYLFKDGKLNLSDEDEIVKRSLVTRDGEMVSEIVKSFKG